MVEKVYESNFKDFRFSNLSGNVVFHEAEDKKTKIIVKKNEEKVIFKEKKNCLHIKGDIETNDDNKSILGKFFGRNINISSSNNIIINGESIVSEGIMTGESPKVELEIYIPKGSLENIDLSGSLNLKIPKISNRLTIDKSGQSNIYISNGEELFIDASGQGGIKVDNVKKVNVDRSGQGSLELSNVTYLDVDTSGQGSIILNKTKNFTEKVKIEGSGMGSIALLNEIKDLDIDVSGMINVKVSREVQKKKIETSGMSSVNFI